MNADSLNGGSVNADSGNVDSINVDSANVDPVGVDSANAVHARVRLASIILAIVFWRLLFCELYSFFALRPKELEITPKLRGGPPSPAAPPLGNVFVVPGNLRKKL